MTDRIDLTGIEVWARHGALPEEKTKDQLFVVDVGVHFDTSRAAVSDDLDDTIDYGTLAQAVHDLVAAESHNLIETVADRVATRVLEDARVRARDRHRPQATGADRGSRSVMCRSRSIALDDEVRRRSRLQPRRPTGSSPCARSTRSAVSPRSKASPRYTRPRRSGALSRTPISNAVVVLDSPMEPMELLQRLQAIEAGHQRERTVHWGPRTLDLDIVAMDPGTVDTDLLTVPHPRAAERRFVLEPLCDVWPEARVGAGVTASQAKGNVGDQAVDLLAQKWVSADAGPGRYWVIAQLVLFVVFAIALVMDGSLPGTSADPLNIAGGGPDGWRIVGAFFLVGGGVGLVVAARSLGQALTALPEPLAGATLVESGPYRYVRHPDLRRDPLALARGLACCSRARQGTWWSSCLAFSSG